MPYVLRWHEPGGTRTKIYVCSLSGRIAKTSTCEECSTLFCTCRMCLRNLYWWKRDHSDVCECEECARAVFADEHAQAMALRDRFMGARSVKAYRSLAIAIERL